jgi:hypothetical protein
MKYKMKKRLLMELWDEICMNRLEGSSQMALGIGKELA